MVQALPCRPITGGTNNGVRPTRYDYWRTGYGERMPSELDFWVAQAGQYHCKAAYVTGDFEHSHRTQLFYHLEGDAVFEYPGRRYQLSRGDLLIIPVGYSFTYRTCQGMRHHWFAVEGEWPAVFGVKERRLFSLPYDAELEAKFIAMREILILRKAGYPLQAIGELYGLFARLAERYDDPNTPESVYPEAVRNAMIYLRENYATPFDAPKTASAVGLSESHLRALFQKWLGESPKRVHSRYRIEQAKRLLSEQYLTIFEIAYHVGFSDPRHFSRVFKQLTGIPPSQYVKNKG